MAITKEKFNTLLIKRIRENNPQLATTMDPQGIADEATALMAELQEQLPIDEQTNQETYVDTNIVGETE